LPIDFSFSRRFEIIKIATYLISSQNQNPVIWNDFRPKSQFKKIDFQSQFSIV